MSNKRRHAICDACWYERNPDNKAPVRFVTFKPEVCCYCGEHTTSGIYVRDEPGVPQFCTHDGLEEMRKNG